VNTQENDVVDVTIGSRDHTTLVAAVKAADLVSTLKGKGPFTVFAPTNAAFDKLPEGTVEGLLKPEKKEALSGILTYHVISGTLDAAAVGDAIKAGHEATIALIVDGSVPCGPSQLARIPVSGRDHPSRYGYDL